MKTCYYCRGNVEAARVNHVAERGGLPIMIRDLAVEKCMQCGEVFFDLEASAQIDDALKGITPPVDSVQVPVYQGH